MRLGAPLAFPLGGDGLVVVVSNVDTVIIRLLPQPAFALGSPSQLPTSLIQATADFELVVETQIAFEGGC